MKQPSNLSWPALIVCAFFGTSLGLIFFGEKESETQIEVEKTDILLVYKSFVPYQVISVDSGRTLFSGDSIYYSEFIDTLDIHIMVNTQSWGAIRREILDTLYIPNIYITHKGRRFRVRADTEDHYGE